MKADIRQRINVQVHVRAAGSDDDWVLVSEEHNRLTTLGIEALTRIWSGAQFRPNQVRLGTGTSTPAPSQTALDTEVYAGSIDRYTHPANDTVVFSTLLTIADGNGNTLAEAALYVDETMISRAAINPPIVKTASIEAKIQFKYTLAEEL